MKCNAISHEARKIAHAFPLKYISLDFPSLVGNAESYEREIRLIVAQFFVQQMSVICDFVEVKADNVLKINKTPYSFLHNDAFPKRKHILLVQSLRPSGEETFTVTNRINEFGHINSVEVTVPASLRDFASTIIYDLAEIYRSAYLSIEESFVTKYLGWRFSLFDMIYTLTNTHLRIANCPELVGRFWFSVTDLKKVRFRYQFDRIALEKSIRWLKEMEDNSLGPYYGLSLLLVQDANDVIFGADKFKPDLTSIDDRTKIVKFENLPHFSQGQAGFFIAEAQLYNSEAMACIDVITTDRLSLQINCPVEHREKVDESLLNAADDIKKMFLDHQDNYEKDLRKMNSALDRLKESKGWLRDISVDFAAKFAAELARG